MQFIEKYRIVIIFLALAGFVMLISLGVVARKNLMGSTHNIGECVGEFKNSGSDKVLNLNAIDSIMSDKIILLGDHETLNHKAEISIKF